MLLLLFHILRISLICCDFVLYSKSLYSLLKSLYTLFGLRIIFLGLCIVCRGLCIVCRGFVYSVGALPPPPPKIATTQRHDQQIKSSTNMWGNIALCIEIHIHTCSAIRTLFKRFGKLLLVTQGHIYIYIERERQIYSYTCYMYTSICMHVYVYI